MTYQAKRDLAKIAEPSGKSASKPLHDANFPLPLDTAPMEAKSAERLPESAWAWQYEPKWDGFRCLAFKTGTAVDLRAKSGKPLGRYFPEVVAMLTALGADRFVLDGELVIEIDGRLAFDALQMRLHPAESRIGNCPSRRRRGCRLRHAGGTGWSRRHRSPPATTPSPAGSLHG